MSQELKSLSLEEFEKLTEDSIILDGNDFTILHADEDYERPRDDQWMLEQVSTYAFRDFVDAGLLKIVAKDASLIPLKMNKSQELVIAAMERQIAAGKPVRIIVLKARQKGISTVFEGVNYVESITHTYRKSLIIGHDKKASSKLLAMYHTFNENLPEKLQPTLKNTNINGLIMKKLKSEIHIATAERGDKVERGGTYQFVHATEVAFWNNGAKAFLALLQAVAEIANTTVILESTANGIGGAFYEYWQNAVSGESDFEPIFISWLIDDEYTRQFESDDVRTRLLQTIDEDEKILLNLGATYEHLYWRRKQIVNKCNGDKEQFRQEYPSTPEEAFVTTGRPVFDKNALYKGLNNSKPPIKRGLLEPVYDVDNKDFKRVIAEGNFLYRDLIKFMTGVRWVDDPAGFIRIYSEDLKINPREKHRFCLGGDVAEGLEQKDYSVLKIWDRRNKDVPITWHGHIDPDLLAREVHKLQVFLGGDLCSGIERNNHGLTVINSAYHMGVNLYFAEEYSNGYKQDTTKAGFKTTRDSKKYGIDLLNEKIREGQYRDKEREFWNEAFTFVRNASGSMQAQGKDVDLGTKCFDDRVMSAMIMMVVDQWLPHYRMLQIIKEPEWLNRFRHKRKKYNNISPMGI